MIFGVPSSPGRAGMLCRGTRLDPTLDRCNCSPSKEELLGPEKNKSQICFVSSLNAFGHFTPNLSPLGQRGIAPTAGTFRILAETG